MTKNSESLSLFIPCMIDQVYPEMGMAMVRVLERLGYSLNYNPEQVCCGQPAFNAGQLDESRKVASHFCSCFNAADTIICPSGSCTSMVRNHYKTLFKGKDQAETADAIGNAVVEFSEFLHKEGLISGLIGEYKARIAFHCSCHALRELGLDQDIPYSILRKIHGIELAIPDVPHKCCGFGGLFYAKFPAISDNMTEQRLEQLLEGNVDLIVSNDPGCIMTLRRMLEKMKRDTEVIHLAELLDRAMH